MRSSFTADKFTPMGRNSEIDRNSLHVSLCILSRLCGRKGTFIRNAERAQKTLAKRTLALGRIYAENDHADPAPRGGNVLPLSHPDFAG